ncbi:bile acid:sodium symporter family protein [Algibacter sp.]|nr:bile acid:sodium symporter family protein [Algibacter sp.]MDA9069376.1 bile acid:sodium symporter family protein [Algibacter sp.]MDA9344197.1 bile acid:sodium symporter family protein [Algibacter sp.]MDA9774946.1 bile acid:sodium symporter family protein [Algibacter sp.]MDC1227207.1 bile acid:sodium symporter family protein [Algibacter sp.]MDC1365150.1 bile acid:sodium symporter family protein [Algibacter sp.]
MQELDKVQINFDSNSLWVLNLALAVVMFGVALGITFDDFKQLLKQPKLVLIGVLLQFVFLPLVTFLLVILIKPQPSIALGMFMVAACPGGNISNFMTHLAKGNTALSVSLTAFATFLAMFMMPFNFSFYSELYEPTAQIIKTVELDSFELVKLVLLILGVPLLFGMLLRHKNTALALKLSKLLKPLSILVFVVIIVIAFSNNIDVFNNYIHYVFAIGVTHNLIALTLGFLVAKMFRLSFENQKTLAIETGIQNSGLGLLLIFSFFNGLGGMAILVAFWGIWHIVSGLLLAFFWSRKKTIKI